MGPFWFSFPRPLPMLGIEPKASGIINICSMTELSSQVAFPSIKIVDSTFKILRSQQPFHEVVDSLWPQQWVILAESKVVCIWPVLLAWRTLMKYELCSPKLCALIVTCNTLQLDDLLRACSVAGGQLLLCALCECVCFIGVTNYPSGWPCLMSGH